MHTVGAQGTLAAVGRLPPAPGALSPRLGVGPSVLPLPAHSCFFGTVSETRTEDSVSDGFFLTPSCVSLWGCFPDGWVSRVALLSVGTACFAPWAAF